MRTTPALLLLFVTACGGSGSTASSTIPPDTEPSVVLEVRDEGGFAPVEWIIARMPRHVLMSDGTLYGPAAITARYPGPLLPAVTVADLDGQAFSDVLQYAEDIGFAGIDQLRDDEALQTVADAPDTVVTFFDQTGPHVFSVYGLGFLERPADIRVSLLNEMVMLLDRATASGGTGGIFVPQRIEVVAGVREMPVEQSFLDERPWPLPVGFAEMGDTVAGWRCLTLEGEEMDAALTVFETATQATDWSENGTSYTMVVRYLYPHQEGC